MHDCPCKRKRDAGKSGSFYGDGEDHDNASDNSDHRAARARDSSGHGARSSRSDWTGSVEPMLNAVVEKTRACCWAPAQSGLGRGGSLWDADFDVHFVFGWVRSEYFHRNAGSYVWPDHHRNLGH